MLKITEGDRKCCIQQHGWGTPRTDLSYLHICTQQEALNWVILWREGSFAAVAGSIFDNKDGEKEALTTAVLRRKAVG